MLINCLSIYIHITFYFTLLSLDVFPCYKTILQLHETVNPGRKGIFCTSCIHSTFLYFVSKGWICWQYPQCKKEIEDVSRRSKGCMPEHHSREKKNCPYCAAAQRGRDLLQSCNWANQCEVYCHELKPISWQQRDLKALTGLMPHA